MGEDQGEPRLPGSSRRPCSEAQERSISLRTYGSHSPLRAASPRPLQLRGRCHLCFLGRDQPRTGEAAGALGTVPARARPCSADLQSCSLGSQHSLWDASALKQCWGRRGMKVPRGLGQGKTPHQAGLSSGCSVWGAQFGGSACGAQHWGLSLGCSAWRAQHRELSSGGSALRAQPQGLTAACSPQHSQLQLRSE